jgi:hypothetical protein
MLFRRFALPAHVRILFALLSAVAALRSEAVAGPKPDKPQDVAATVIAHVPLPSAAGNQMLFQRKGSKQYLYVQKASKEGFIIVDVTKPNRPNILRTTASVTEATAGSLEMVGPDVALAESPEKRPTAMKSVPLPAQSVRVLDMSNPADPRTLQTFEGVTSFLTDNSRNLIYIANGDGLWILRHTQSRAPRPKCDSESVFSPIADCQ